MTELAIETEALTVYYGKHRGIVDLSLQVRPGEVFGFLGPNGAGKTTTLRVLVDLIRPNRGKARVLGLDCQKEGVALRDRIGYLPGELSLPRNMKGREYLQIVDSLRRRPADPGYLRRLCERLDLDTGRKIRDYSSGNKQKLGLVVAMMARPELLMLDEPTNGLDPLIQQVVLELVDEARDEGRTVFFSSHILSEVQSVCDRVGIIREGRVIKVESVESLTAQPFHRLRLRFEKAPDAGAFAFEGVRELGRAEDSITLEVTQNLPQVMQAAAALNIVDIETHPVTLEEVFLAYYGRNSKNGRANGGTEGGQHA
jgi:ABC-2 type transport system ATP-binding protein